MRGRIRGGILGMVTKKQDLSRDEIWRAFDALPDDATVSDFIDRLAEIIGLERRDGQTEPAITNFDDQMKKQKLMESLGRLPDDATVDDFAYRLYVISQIEKGRAASRAGDKVTQKEARERLKRWLR